MFQGYVLEDFERIRMKSSNPLSKGVCPGFIQFLDEKGSYAIDWLIPSTSSGPFAGTVGITYRHVGAIHTAELLYDKLIYQDTIVP